MSAARTAGMVAASVAWGAVLLLAWPFIRQSIEDARRNLEGCR
jgi:hypothetical protein